MVLNKGYRLKNNSFTQPEQTWGDANIAGE